MALGSTQPLPEMSTRNISWGWGDKGGQWVGVTTLPPSCTDCLAIWKICDLLCCYAARSGNSLPTFRYNLSVPSSKVKGLVFSDP